MHRLLFIYLYPPPHAKVSSFDLGAAPGETPLPKLTHERLLADRQFSDLTITLASRKFTAHTAVIAIVCPALFSEKDKTSLEKTKKKKPSAPISIDLARFDKVS